MTHGERQLNELYLPLLMMQSRGKMVFRMFLQILGRHYVFGTHKLPDEEMTLWTYWSEHAFIPMNEQIADTIQNGIEENLFVGAIPASFHRFMGYHKRFKQTYSEWKRDGGEYQHPGNFPADFEEDILRSISRLSLETGWLPKFLT